MKKYENYIWGSTWTNLSYFLRGQYPNMFYDFGRINIYFPSAEGQLQFLNTDMNIISSKTSLNCATCWPNAGHARYKCNVDCVLTATGCFTISLPQVSSQVSSIMFKQFLWSTLCLTKFNIKYETIQPPINTNQGWVPYR